MAPALQLCHSAESAPGSPLLTSCHQEQARHAGCFGRGLALFLPSSFFTPASAQPDTARLLEAATVVLSSPNYLHGSGRRDPGGSQARERA